MQTRTQTHKQPRRFLCLVWLGGLALLVACQQTSPPSPEPDVSLQVNVTVNSTADAADVSPGNGVCETAPGNGVCTLRAALEESNARTDFPTDVITLPAGTYILTLGELKITDSLFLNGEGAEVTVIDGNSASRVMVIRNTGKKPIVNIRRITIQNGNAAYSISGGGIYIGEGAYLGLYDSVVTNNAARQFGGGVSNAGQVLLRRTTVSGNRVPTDGGGGQTASGGGLLNFRSGLMTLEASTISGNEATRGGGLRNAGGRLRITNSTISGNRASTRGGGVMNFGTASIAASTITNNAANTGRGGLSEDKFGGGIYNIGQMFLGRTLIAGNTDNRSRFEANFAPDCYSKTEVMPGESEIAHLTSFRRNLVGVVNGNCDLRDASYGDTRFDLTGSEDAPLDPRLGLLADNGGPTQTHSLLSGSPAIDSATFGSSASFSSAPTRTSGASPGRWTVTATAAPTATSARMKRAPRRPPTPTLPLPSANS